MLLSAEDNPADTIRPRLDAQRANPCRVHILKGILQVDAKGVRENVFTLAELPALESALKEIRPRLVVIDPIGSYLGGRVDAHRENEVRAVLAPLADMAERYSSAILLVAHTKKQSVDFADDAALGSRAFIGIARSVWHVHAIVKTRTVGCSCPGNRICPPAFQVWHFRSTTAASFGNLKRWRSTRTIFTLLNVRRMGKGVVPVRSTAAG